MSKKSELCDAIWKSAGPLRRAVGRDRFDAIFEDAIATAPTMSAVVLDGNDSVAIAEVSTLWRSRIRRRQQNVTFGPIFWFVVGSCINFVVSRLLEWMFNSHANGILLAGWRVEQRP